MILERLVFSNFGPFAGEQELVFAGQGDGSGPITLVGGMNGFGKTTILDALHLVLFGKLATCSNRNGMGYAEYLGKCIHHGHNPEEGSSLALEFQLNLDGENARLKIQRWWARDRQSVKESFQVWVNESPDNSLTKGWAEFLEEVLPRSLASLFFFDAERIERLADPETSAQAIGTAVGALLGIDVLDQLSSDLVVLDRKRRSNSEITLEEQEIVEAELKLEQLQEERRRLRETMASTRTFLGREEKILKEVEDKFRRQGGQLWLELGELETDRDRLKEEISEATEDLQREAASHLPLLMVRHVLDSASAQDEREQAARNASAIATILGKRDEELARQLEEFGISPGNRAAIHKFLCDDRRRYESQADHKPYLDCDEQGHALLQKLVATDLSEAAKRTAEVVHHFETLLARIENIERRLQGLPEAQQVESVQKQRELCLGRVEALKSQLSSSEADLRSLESSIETVERQYASTLRRFAESQIDLREESRLRAHSARVRQTLSVFRNKLLDLHLERVEQLVLESFCVLLSKKSLVTGVDINRSTFEVSLSDGKGRKVNASRLSAGERQLLAIAILWGLAKAASQEIPVVVDTPLGRLDSAHRLRLVREYFPHAANQVLLLSTDEEVDEELFDEMKQHIGSAYLLTHRDSDQSTVIVPGYFWERNIAAAS